MSQTPPPPIPVAYESRIVDVDQTHLNVLGICYWVWGAITALFSSFGLIHVTIGILAVSGKLPHQTTTQPVSDELFGWLFIIIGGLVVSIGWTIGLLSIYAGMCLRKNRRWLLCMVVGALNCLSIPIGTVLGVFTFIVLARPAVKARFGIGITEARAASGPYAA